MADFSHLKSFCGPKELQDLYNTFDEETKTLLADLSKSIEGKDAETARRLAHQLKGLASTLGAADMQLVSSTLEGHFKQSEWDPAEGLLLQLSESVQRVKIDLKKAAFPDKI